MQLELCGTTGRGLVDTASFLLHCVYYVVQATELAKTLLNRTLNGKVALSMKGCLWLDPLIEQQMLSNLHVLETTVNIRYELQEKKLASSNPTVGRRTG